MMYEIQNLYLEHVSIEGVRSACEGTSGEYWFILHDKDIDKEGQLKKPHFHCYIRLSCTNAKRSIEKAFKGISSRIVSVSNQLACIKYLTHKLNPTKHQYDDLEVQTNAPLEYQRMLTNVNKKTDISIMEMAYQVALKEYPNYPYKHRIMELVISSGNEGLITSSFKFYKLEIASQIMYNYLSKSDYEQISELLGRDVAPF